MFDIHHREVNSASISQQIQKFENELSPDDSFTVNFFSDNMYDWVEDGEEMPPSIADSELQHYLKFLKRNNARIEKVIINPLLDSPEAPMAYAFLGQCLSTLTHVSLIELTDETISDDLVFTLCGLGDALNRLGSFEHLSDLMLNLYHLTTENASDEDIDDFANFVASCENLDKFEVWSCHLNMHVIHQIIEKLIELPYLDSVQITWTDSEKTLSEINFNALGKIFTSPSIRDLSIDIDGKVLIDEAHANLSVQDCLQEFIGQLDPSSPLEKLTLSFSYFIFHVLEVQNHQAPIYTMDAFTPISHHKNLKELSLLLPHGCYRPEESTRWAHFLRNFEYSNLISIELVSLPGMENFSNTLQLAVQPIVQNNQRISNDIQYYKDILQSPNPYRNFRGSIFQQNTLEVVREYDKRLLNVELRLAHQYNLLSQLNETDPNFRLYYYFCNMLVLKFNHPARHALQIPSPIIMMYILSYLHHKDLSQMIKLNPGILEFLRQEIIFKLNHTTEEQGEFQDFNHRIDDFKI